ncbi:MAG: type II secretion system protein [Sedimentisphaerales bacterium]
MENKKKGFTLVELLVVISIISLLMAILLPSLNKARQAAYSVVCISHLRQCGVAMSIYATDHDDYLAGPDTSGIELNSNTAPSDSSPTVPVQNMDWVSPTLGKELALPRNRFYRIAKILNTALRCPANREKNAYIYDADPAWPPDLPAESLRYSSYSAALGFHLCGENVVGKNIITAYELESDNEVSIPPNYLPLLQMIGKPSDKIYVLDGARYIDPSLGLSFNDFPKQIEGGNFMLYGPATPLTGDPYVGALKGIGAQRHLDPTPNNYKYGWRHNKGLNAVFFDGHCANLKAQDSLSISYYFPKGTTVLNPALTQDLNATKGMVIQ